MTGGSLQLQRYRAARAAGVPCDEAERTCGLVTGEGAMVDADDARVGVERASRNPLPVGPFGCILADPPWAFRTFSGENMTPHRCAEDHYRTMDFAELSALPIGEIAAKDCALFMWVVGSHLAESIELAAAWGFTFKTDAFYWIKQRLIGADQIDIFTGDIAEPRMGFGYWTRKQVEPCWLFTRGSPKRLSKGVRQVIVEPRREHSRKPDAQYPRIEALVGGPYLELFARQPRSGWSAWGNQVDRFAEAA